MFLFRFNRENPPVFTFLLQNEKRLYQRTQTLILQTVLTCLINTAQAQRWQHNVETQHIKGNVAAAYKCMPKDIMSSETKYNSHGLYLQGRKRYIITKFKQTQAWTSITVRLMVAVFISTISRIMDIFPNINGGMVWKAHYLFELWAECKVVVPQVN